jgi:hypothetical protein
LHCFWYSGLRRKKQFPKEKNKVLNHRVNLCFPLIPLSKSRLAPGSQPPESGTYFSPRSPDTSNSGSLLVPASPSSIEHFMTIERE